MSADTTEAHVKLVEAKVGEWGTRLELLKAKIATAGAAGNVRLTEQLDHWQKLHARGTEHLAELRASASNKWQDAKTAVEEKWHKLSTAAEQFWANVKM